MTPPRAVLFDIDGTLVDSNDAHAHAWVAACAAEGIDVAFARVRPLIGMGGDQLLPRLLGISKGSPQGKRITAQRSKVFAEQFLPHLTPFPGTADLLRRLHADGLKIGAATSAQPDELRQLLQVTGAPEVFQETTSSGDAQRSKPAPDIVQAALERCGVTAAEAVLVGDAPYDVESAGKAGVGVIGVRCGGFSDEELGGALAIYDGPADLLAHLDNSPLRS